VNFRGGLSLAVANFDSNTVSVLRGKPDGSFGRPVQYAVGANPEYVLAVDLNGDGQPDLVTANLNSDTSVLQGKANGTFGATTNYTVGSEPYWVAEADFNGDGTFQGATSFRTGGGLPTSIAVGLFNVDAKPDLAIANRCRSTLVYC